MLKELNSFITDIYSFLIPELALAGGMPLPPVKREEKPDLMVAKGSFFSLKNFSYGLFGGGKKNSFNGSLLDQLKMQANQTPVAVAPESTTTTVQPSLPAPSAPAPIVIPPAPVPPPPPPAPGTSSADIAAAQQQGAFNAQKGFGYKASLLRGIGMKDPATNTATGSGSLLGN
jgi:hypothetical protein